MKKPFGIYFIGGFQIFGALAILMTLSIPQYPAFNIRFGVPFIPELWVKIIVVIVAFLLAYGYLKLTKWGYYGMLVYSILFCGISLFQALAGEPQPFLGNGIYAAIVVVYTLLHTNTFRAIK